MNSCKVPCLLVPDTGLVDFHCYIEVHVWKHPGYFLPLLLTLNYFCLGAITSTVTAAGEQGSSSTTENRITTHLSIPLLIVHPGGLKARSCGDVWAPLLTAALQPPKSGSSPVLQGINRWAKLVHAYSVVLFSHRKKKVWPTWVNLEDNMPSKIKQPPEDKYWIIPLTMNSQILRDGEWVERSLLGAGGEGKAIFFIGAEFSFCTIKGGLEKSGDHAPLLCIDSTPLSCMLQKCWRAECRLHFTPPLEPCRLYGKRYSYKLDVIAYG